MTLLWHKIWGALSDAPGWSKKQVTSMHTPKEAEKFDDGIEYMEGAQFDNSLGE